MAGLGVLAGLSTPLLCYAFLGAHQAKRWAAQLCLRVDTDAFREAHGVETKVRPSRLDLPGLCQTTAFQFLRVSPSLAALAMWKAARDFKSKQQPSLGFALSL